MKPLAPKPGKGWVKIADTYVPTSKNAAGWHHLKKQIVVLSSVDPSGNDGSEEYHLSISVAQGRCPDSDAMRTLREFSMDNAHEDNSESRVPQVRHFWQTTGEGKT